MEVGLQSSEIPSAEHFIAQRRSELSQFRHALVGWTCLAAFILALWSGTVGRQHSLWKKFHEDAFAAVNAQLRGDAKPSLPANNIGLDHITYESYLDLFQSAKEYGQKGAHKRRHVAHCVDLLEKISERYQEEDLKELRRDYTILEQLGGEVRQIESPFLDLMSMDSDVNSLRGYWLTRWRHAPLDFSLDTNALEVADNLNVRKLAIEKQVEKENAYLMEAAILDELELPFDASAYVEKDDWVTSVPLDAKHVVVARWQVNMAMSSLLTGLDIYAQMPHYAKPAQYNLGPGITLL